MFYKINKTVTDKSLSMYRNTVSVKPPPPPPYSWCNNLIDTLNSARVRVSSLCVCVCNVYSWLLALILYGTIQRERQDKNIYKGALCGRGDCMGRGKLNFMGVCPFNWLIVLFMIYFAFFCLTQLFDY